MERIFTGILSMSGKAGLIILIVLMIRQFLKRSPKLLSCFLWAAVLFRLLCPFTLPVNLRLLPEADIPSKIAAVSDESMDSLSQAFAEQIQAVSDRLSGSLQETADRASEIIPGLPLVLGFVWLTGVLIFTAYALLSIVRLQKRLKGAVKQEDNIYSSDSVFTPFVFGIFRPKIYLPSGLSEQERRYIILHEQIHIRRQDSLFRFAAFAALILHWFNPLVWLAFFLSEQDMEMACDESVVKQLNGGRREYSALLLKLGSQHPNFASPLSFGNGGIKGRIQNVLRFRKPPLWAAVCCAGAVLLLCAVLISEPLSGNNKNGMEQIMTVSVDGTDLRIQPVWYEGGFDFNYDRLLTIPIQSDQIILTFQSEDSSLDTLLLGEDYYSDSRVTRETYEIEKDGDGIFRIPITKKRAQDEEQAIYYAKYGNGVYVFRLLLE